MNIDDKYVDRVIAYVNKSAIEHQELKEDLIDHLCCYVEMEMANGQTFDTAFRIAREQTAPNGLGEIQYETFFLFNYSKIIRMKRLTYLLGYFFTIVWVAGVFFKLMHLPGASNLLYGGGLGFACIFIPFLLIYRHKKIMREVLSERLKWITGCVSIVLFMVASWMQVYHLQGEALMLALSFLFFMLGFLPFFFFRMYKKTAE